MRPIARALCWGSVFILLAVANATGFVGDEGARVLFVVLPLLAWLSLSGAGCCIAKTRRAAR